MHYYQHNIGDYARDTGHLTVLEHGIYRLLLDWCYLNERPITTEQAIRVSRGNPVETQSVLSEFFLHENGEWTHKRVGKEIADYHVKADKNRQNGAKGGRPKPSNNPLGSQTDAKHNPNQEPLTNNHKPITNKKEEVQAPEGVSPQVWEDFKKSRKKLRAELTQTAIDGIKREAHKAGWTTEAALIECCVRGWRGFKSDWFDEKQKTRFLPPQPNETVPGRSTPDPELLRIERESKAAAPVPENLREKFASLTKKVTNKEPQ